jgi:hypothetical protein
MLSNNFEEGQEKKIRLENFPAASVKELIAFLYVGQLSCWSKLLDMKLMMDLLLLGDLYDIKELKALAADGYLTQPLFAEGSDYKEKLDVDLAIRWFHAICLQDSDDLIQRSAQFIAM